MSPDLNMTASPHDLPPAVHEAISTVHCAELRADFVRSRIAQGERVTAKSIEALLYALTFVKDPKEPEDRRIHRRARLQQIAQMAVALVDESAEHEAERRVMLALQADLVNDMEAQIREARYSRSRYLIERALRDLVNSFLLTKPWQGLLGVYRAALQKGGQ